MQKICAAYIRVSTHDQEEYSPESQIKLIRDYARKNGMMLPEEYIFRDDGISGRTAEKRPDFMRMIATAKQKPRPFESILVWKFSRFARNQEESVVYKSLLKKENGIDVISISEPLMEGPFGGLIERIIEWFDAFYSANLSAEVRRGMTERASRGLPVSTSPLGYRYKEKSLCMVPDEADAVRMIYRDFLSGSSIMGIAKKLNSLGIKTKRGGTWENRTVRYILTNPIYTGKLRWCTDGANDYHTNSVKEGTMLVEGAHEAIVSPEDFAAAQSRMESYLQRYKGDRPKAQRQDAGHMLQGLVRCSACGGTLTYTGTGMNCSRYVHGKCKASHFISEGKLEALAISALWAQMESLDFKLVVRQRPQLRGEQQRLEQLIKKEKEMLRRYREAYAAGVDTLDEYRVNKVASEKRMEALAKQLGQLASPPPPDKDAFAQKHRESEKVLLSDFLTAAEKNSLLRGFVDHMVFYKATKEVEIIYYI